MTPHDHAMGRITTRLSGRGTRWLASQASGGRAAQLIRQADQNGAESIGDMIHCDAVLME